MLVAQIASVRYHVTKLQEYVHCTDMTSCTSHRHICLCSWFLSYLTTMF